MTYEDFFTETEVATFKRVKKGQMHLAEVCREVIRDMVGGVIQDHGPEFLRTNRGLYRIAMSSNSDNTLERAAHDAAGAETVIIESDEAVKDFFQDHDLDPFHAIQVFQNLVRARLAA